MNSYKALSIQKFSIDKYSIVPIRFEDRMDILKWRNEQIYHLRQDSPLTEIDQENYFSNVISKIFDLDQPNQMLFSYLENDICIGYGGLVHINWIDKNAEISFIMNTMLENEYFNFHWTNYLKLIERVAFKNLCLHKIFIYAFDLRPHLYNVIEDQSYINEARLKDHCLFNNKHIDVLIYSKLSNHEK